MDHQLTERGLWLQDAAASGWNPAPKPILDVLHNLFNKPDPAQKDNTVLNYSSRTNMWRW